MRYWQYVVVILLNSASHSSGQEVPGCGCMLSYCCMPSIKEEVKNMTWLTSEQAVLTSGELHSHTEPAAAACELLAFSKDVDTTCTLDIGNTETVCDGVKEEILEEFPPDSGMVKTVLGRYVGKGGCSKFRGQACPALPEDIRFDQWFRDELGVHESKGELDFGAYGTANFRLQLDESCDFDHAALKMKATWNQIGATQEIEAAETEIAEGNWGGPGPVKYFCVDLKTPEGVAAGYYALYLKVGDSPCRVVNAFKGHLAEAVKSGGIIGLVALICCLICCVVLVVMCCGLGGGGEDEEGSDEEEEEDEFDS